MFKKIKMLNTAVNGKMFTLNLYFILITMVLPFVQMHFLPLDKEHKKGKRGFLKYLLLLYDIDPTSNSITFVIVS